MSSVIEQMLSKYDVTSTGNKKDIMKEVVQEVMLCGLSRAGFFNNAAFYGGTALRIFHQLDRFSEVLDFSLKSPNPMFNLTEYFPLLEKELRAYGLNFEVTVKEKSRSSDIVSAFVKGNTKEHIMLFYADDDLAKKIGIGELVKIKFEVDTNPPEYAKFESKFRLLPIPYEASLYDLPSLFAGKIHAVICRGWKNRVKGRDLYDYVFYRSKNIPVNLKHLNISIVRSRLQSRKV